MAGSVALAFDVLARDRASRTLNSIGDSAERTGGRVSRLGSHFANFGKVAAVGLGAAAVGAVALGKSFVDAAIESQKVTKQTAAVIKSMGGASNVTAQQVADLSEKLSMQSGIDDELIQSGQNVLLTFGKVQNKVGKGNKIFDRATEAALNMSVALGTDLQSANIQVGKALNDPIKGITALSRAGVSFTQKQKDTIKKLVETGDVLGAQKIILGELDKQFGGSAAAQATAGDKLKVIWGNLQEDLGERLLPIFESVATWLSSALPTALDAAGRFLSPFVEQIGAFWSTLTTGMTEDEGTPIERFALFLRENVPAAVEVLKGFVEDGLKALSNWWDENGDNVVNFFEDVGTAIQTAAGYASTIATVIKEEVLPRLGDFAGWIGDNEARMDIFRGAIIALAGAWAVYSGATALAAGTTLLALAPYILLGALVVGLTYLTQELADAFDDQLNVALQWIIDRSADILGFLADVLDLAVRALAAVVALKEEMPSGDDFLPLVPGPLQPLVGALPIGDDGGVWPGPRGVHSLGWVAGGETLVPTHKPGVSLASFDGGGGFDAVGEDQLLELRRQNGLLVRIANAVDRGPSISEARALSAVRR